MNDQDFEKVMAYFDQELSPDQQADVEKLLAEDAEARDFLAQLRQSDEFVQGGLNSILDEPVPQHLVDAARGKSASAESSAPANEPTAPVDKGSNVVAFPKRGGISRWAFATAASITLMVAAGTFMMAPDESQNPNLAQALNEGLEQTASGEVYGQPGDPVQVMPVATFRTAEAGVCRQFAASQQGEQTVGLACRSGTGEWQVRTSRSLASGENPQSYAPASGDGGAIADALESVGGGEPLSASDEQALLSEGWQ